MEHNPAFPQRKRVINPSFTEGRSYGGLKKDCSFSFNELIQRQHRKASWQLPIFAKILPQCLASAHNFLERDQGGIFVVVTVDQLIGFVLLENRELFFIEICPESAAPVFSGSRWHLLEFVRQDWPKSFCTVCSFQAPPHPAHGHSRTFCSRQKARSDGICARC